MFAVSKAAPIHLFGYVDGRVGVLPVNRELVGLGEE
jgi:hypothetical protein